jgi:hypothetical protein
MSLAGQPGPTDVGGRDLCTCQEPDWCRWLVIAGREAFELCPLARWLLPVSTCTGCRSAPATTRTACGPMVASSRPSPRYERRARCDLYHAALEVGLGDDRFVIEMAPVWSLKQTDRGVVCEGAVGLRWLGRSRLFRYEVRRWRDGVIPDASEAVDSPRRLSADPVQAARVLALVPAFPTATWGRNELKAGGAWNSNSLIAWLLARSGHDMPDIGPPAHGRAPGWSAGLVIAQRNADADRRGPGGTVRRSV